MCEEMMTTFATVDVLSTSTCRLLGDIGGVYKVTSFLIGRDAYTHDLAFYGRRASDALRAAVPNLPGPDDAEHVTQENYRECLAQWEQELGQTIDLPESLRDCLADDKNALETLKEMVPPEKIIVIGAKPHD
jgi:hypothetical protein